MSSNKRIIFSLFGLSLAARLTACAAGETIPTVSNQPLLPTQQWRAEISSEPYGFALAPNGPNLSQAQQQAIGQLVYEWRENGTGILLVETPEGGGPAAAQTAIAIQAAIRSLGVREDQVNITGYAAGTGMVLASGDRAPIRVSFLHWTATPPRCGQYWDNLTHTFENKPYANFGCAVTANIAVHVANPADLAGARGVTPPDAGRRQVVLDRYRAGETTSSAKDDQADGTSSQVN